MVFFSLKRAVCKINYFYLSLTQKSKIEENGEKKSHENATKKRKKSQSHHSNGNHHKHSKHDTEAVNSAKEKTDSNGKSGKYLHQ